MPPQPHEDEEREVCHALHHTSHTQCRSTPLGTIEQQQKAS